MNQGGEGMREGTEITRFSLAFTAGIIAATVISAYISLPYRMLSVILSASFMSTAAVLGYILMKKSPGIRTICLAFFAAGITAALLCLMTGGAGNTFSGPVSQAASVSVSKLKNLIDGIPFESPVSGAMIKALLTGDRSGLPANITGTFRESGAAHLLALSGMHLGVIYAIMSWILSSAGNSLTARYARSAVIVTASWFYTLMTGAGPSITRAFLFILLNETASVTGRPRISINVFSIALMIQLLYDPGIIASIGFQLSYLAMAGIFTIYPHVKAWFPEGDGKRNNPMKKIWDTASMSISCQLFTAPAVWYHFGTFPLYFVITNLIAIPLTSLIIGLSLTVIMLSATGMCPDILLSVNESAIKALTSSLEVISGL